MRKNQGFTLIELIVVLAIIGIIAGVTVPRFTGSFDTIKFRKTMSELVNFLREGRIKAMATSGTTNIVFDLHRGFCWSEDKRVLKIPREIEMFSDKIEARNDQIKSFTFYPNGTALEEKLGFVCGKMAAVLHVDPLGGLPYYKINEEMEQVVRYSRNEAMPSEEEIQKDIDKLKESVTVKEEVFASYKHVVKDDNRALYKDYESGEDAKLNQEQENESFDENDENINIEENVEGNVDE